MTEFRSWFESKDLFRLIKKFVLKEGSTYGRSYWFISLYSFTGVHKQSIDSTPREERCNYFTLHLSRGYVSIMMLWHPVLITPIVNLWWISVLFRTRNDWEESRWHRHTISSNSLGKEESPPYHSTKMIVWAVDGFVTKRDEIIQGGGSSSPPCFSVSAYER